MKKKLYINACRLFSLLTIVTLFVACDAHRDFPDTAMKPYHILCTDGKVLSVSDFKQSEKQPIAVVFHVNHDEAIEGNGYAVYLWDLAPEAFADSIGVNQRTSADITALDGNENTFAIYDTRETTSPMAEAVFALWRYGQSSYNIHERVLSIIESYLPDELAIEAPFFGKNVQSMLKLGRAQGVAMAVALSRDIPITEYAPLKIKMAITGNGQASKEQVADMLQRMLHFPKEEMPTFMDATDGLAAAYCHFLQMGRPAMEKGYSSWKDFIAKNPDKVK